MARFLPTVGWLALLVFVLPALGSAVVLLLSRLWPTATFVAWYACFRVVWFVIAVPVAGLFWALPSPARAIAGAGVVYLAALVLPFTSTMARYPLHTARCGHLPVVGTTFAAAHSYVVPGSPAYAVTPLDNRLFCTRQEADAAGFHERSD